MAASSALCIYAFDASVPSPYVGDYTTFLLERHVDHVTAMLLEADDTRHFSIEVDFMELLDSNGALAHLTLAFADHMLPLFQEALLQAQQQVYAASAVKPQMCIKQHCHARVYNLHLCPEMTKANISSIRSTDVGALISSRLVWTRVKFFYLCIGHGLMLPHKIQAATSAFRAL